ncbi:MAG: hypothetical protein AAB091_00975, partial [Elusimicrobiota bacterium]
MEQVNDGDETRSLFTLFVSTFTLFILFFTSFFAQAASLQGQGYGARQAGLGLAVVAAGAGNVYGIYYNPAQLGFAPGAEASMDYARLWMGLSDQSNLEQSYVGFVYPWQAPGGLRRAFGIARSEFDLNSPVNGRGMRLFGEEVWYGSYATVLSNSLLRGRLSVGSTIKFITRTFGDIADNANALDNQGAVTGRQDPVLIRGALSKKAWSYDVGANWRHRAGVAFGVSVQDVGEPDLALGPQRDPLSRAIHFGAGWSASPFMVFAAEMELKKRLAGFQDQRWALGAERLIPSARFGDFGLRGSLGAGNRFFKSFSLGATWRSNAVSLDYAYQASMGEARPFGASHRFTLSVRFGQDLPEEEISRLYRDERAARLRAQGELDQALEDLRLMLAAHPGEPVFASTAPLYAPEPVKVAPPIVRIVVKDSREDEFGPAWALYLERKTSGASRAELAGILDKLLDVYAKRSQVKKEWAQIRAEIEADRQDYDRV